jgi:hypothetical protein
MIKWDEVQQAIYPNKSYEDMYHKLRDTLSYQFIQEAYNFSLLELQEYTQKLLGGDPGRRYAGYNSRMIGVLNELHQAGLTSVNELKNRTASRDHLELLQAGITPASRKLLAQKTNLPPAPSWNG